MFPHKTKEEVHFEEPLPGVPESLIQGPHWIKSKLDGSLAFSSSVEKDSLTTEGFSLSTSDPQQNDLFCNWMVLPEADGIWIDRNTESRAGLSGVNETRIPITYNKRYDATPVVCCWFTQIETVQNIAHTKVDVSVVVDKITNEGFELIVKTATGTARLEKFTAAWLSHPKPEGDSNARFLSGDCQLSRGQTKWSQDLPTTLAKDPPARFLAFNRIQAGLGKKPVRIASSFTNGTDRKRIEIEAGPLDDCDLEGVGVTWIVSV